MGKFKEFGNAILARITSWALLVYVIGAVIAGIHFQRQDMRGSDSLLWRLAISPRIGFFKGLIWPYYALRTSPTQQIDTSTASIEQSEIHFSDNKSVNAYLNSLAAYTRAFEYVEGNRTTGDKSKDREIVFKLFSKTETLLKDCNEAELDAIYPGMGGSVTIFKTTIKGVNDKDNSEGANRTSNLFASWVNANKNSLLETLAKGNYLLAPEVQAADD